MPQPKQSDTPSTPAVRGDATTTPAPATAPAKSTEAAVAEVASSEQVAARETAPAAPKPATPKPAAKKPAARKPATRKPAAAKSSAAAKPAAKKPAAKKPAAKKPAAKKPAAAKTSAAAAKPATAKSAAAKPATRKPATRKPAARTAAAAKPARTKPAAARPKAAPAGRAAAPKPRRTTAAASRPARKPAAAPEPTSAAARDEALRANLASLRDLLAGGVVLTAQRLQEAVDEAVTRGRITRRDAEELAGAMINAGRQQTADLVADVEQLLGRGRSDLTSAGSLTKDAVKDSGDRMLREVDRARRTAGIGSFPILGYDDLKAKQIIKRLGDLSPAELRKVRDHERSADARSSILKAIKKALN